MRGRSEDGSRGGGRKSCGELARGEVDIARLERGGRVDDATCDVEREALAKVSLVDVVPLAHEAVVVALCGIGSLHGAAASTPGLVPPDEVQHRDVVAVPPIRRSVAAERDRVS